MKKYLIIAVIIAFALICGATILYCIFSAELTICDKLVELSMIFLQAILTGLVTFLGLLFTFMFQERHSSKLEEIKDRPFLAIRMCEEYQIGPIINSKSAERNIICVSNQETVRLVHCNVFNAKSNVLLNLELELGQKKESICISDSVPFKMYLANDGINQLYFYFEDIHGNNFKRSVDYSYLINVFILWR